MAQTPFASGLLASRGSSQGTSRSVVEKFFNAKGDFRLEEALKERDYWARFAPQPLSMAQLSKHAEEIYAWKMKGDTAIDPKKERNEGIAYGFLRDNILIRLAHMSLDLESLPSSMFKDPNLQEVYLLYIESIAKISTFCEMQDQTETFKAFRKELKNIHDSHYSIVVLIGSALLAFKESEHRDATDPIFTQISSSLDSFFLTRIGVRTLISQHLELYSDEVVSGVSNSQWIGLIDPQCRPIDICEQAIESASFMASQLYGDVPNVRLLGNAEARNHSFSYIPSHLYHIVFELLKNSFRATIESNRESFDQGNDYPPISVILSIGDEDLTIKIADEGGGISRREMAFIWNYAYTTAERPDSTPMADMNNAPLAGFGYGLPISRLYARYLGGDIKILSMDGFGTDAYVYLRLLASKSVEVVPWRQEYLSL
eukprot:CAMPEP_0201549460 /NCGR_PEP_ID=MMETSP0173_2-20130828/5933_1 /ASSEMBLY_ACC=CAM_ASM_000268 /TAXON_ID=218659 /ORGANISM="Vexillifera sp., Strain DIVA3 564/2" /LENGTH=428 /DNA_ID=CAMNT_0047959137 /DNA_START=189 /DNA_END=1475 /DNA_ORIENTATION=+